MLALPDDRLSVQRPVPIIDFHGQAKELKLAAAFTKRFTYSSFR
jgi:hypothetical protein